MTVPESSLIQEQKILIEGLDIETAFSPVGLEVLPSRSRPPTLDDPSPDLTRLLWAIQKQGGPAAREDLSRRSRCSAGSPGCSATAAGT